MATWPIFPLIFHNDLQTSISNMASSTSFTFLFSLSFTFFYPHFPSFTFIFLRTPSFAFINLHSPSFILIHLHSNSFTFIHAHPSLLIFNINFLYLGSRKSYSSVFLGIFSVNWYAGKCYFPAPEISLGKDWLDQWSKVPTEFHNIRMIRESCRNRLCVTGSHLGWASKLLRDYFSRFHPHRPLPPE